MGDLSDSVLQRVGRELKQNPPAVVRKTGKRFGDARGLAQSRAILLNKARSQGAKIAAPKAMIG